MASPFTPATIPSGGLGSVIVSPTDTPSAGEVLTATSATAADWEAPSSGQPVGERVTILPQIGESAQTNFSAFTTAQAVASAIGTRESSGAQNAEVTFKVWLATGTWKLYLLTVTSSNIGIYTVSLDGVSQGTIDGYSAGLTGNVLKTLAGIAALTSGLHDLNFKMATKNASSSSYFGELGLIVLERTA